MRIEIYFEDLSEAKQKELLKAAGIKEPKEANWDIFPITEVEYEVKMLYLIKYEDDYSDEFPVSGMALLTEEKYKAYKECWEYIGKKLNEGSSFEYYFGTNEYIYYDSNSCYWKGAFEFTKIPEEEAKIIKDLIFEDEDYYGTIPTLDYLIDEINDMKEMEKELND